MVFAFVMGSILQVGKKVTKSAQLKKNKSCTTYIYENKRVKNSGKCIVLHKNHVIDYAISQELIHCSRLLLHKQSKEQLRTMPK